MTSQVDSKEQVVRLLHRAWVVLQKVRMFLLELSELDECSVDK